MITIKTGKLFVEKYNEENGTNLTPKDIFCMLADKAFRGGRHMAFWSNSKFKYYLDDYNRHLRGEKDEPSFEDALSAFCNDIENRNCGVETTLNVYGGCAEKGNRPDILPTTEFNYCDNLHFTVDERYCSFIGSFFQICVGGFSTVLNTKDMVWLMYESFNKYYDYIHNDDSVKDKQLSSWNGCYLYQKLKNKNEFITNHKRNGDSIETIDFIEFLDAITFGQGVNEKYLLFENFDQTNTTAGYITLDLEGVKGVFNLIYRVLTNIDNTFKLKEYSTIFLKKNLLRTSFEFGEVTGEMVDPLYEFKKSKNKELKNKNGINFLKAYLKLIMTDKEQELSKNFGEFIKNAPKKGKKTMSVKEETNDVLTSKNVTKFGNAVIDFCKKAGVDHTSGVPFDVVSYFIQDGNSSKLQEFLMYTKFNM